MDDDERLSICRQFHVAQQERAGTPATFADRFLVAKFLRPQRWDVVVFHPPHDPATLYAMRLVGMPGEEVTIRDGQVVINGQVVTPPPELSGIRYSVDEGPRPIRGSEQHPAKLAEGEYFVLGDFSKRTYDSRYWITGYPGHPPFAVPESARRRTGLRAGY